MVNFSVRHAELVVVVGFSVQREKVTSSTVAMKVAHVFYRELLSGGMLREHSAV